MSFDELSQSLPDSSNRPGDLAIDRPYPAGHIIENAEDGSGIGHLLAYDEGYVVGRIENEMLRLKTDAHLVTIAPTGAGKGRGVVIPNLLTHPGSAFVLDIRGETLERTVRRRLMLGQDIVVLDPYNLTGGSWGKDTYNPFDALDSGDLYFENKVRNLAEALMFDPEGRSSNEPIWDNVTRTMLEGVITYIATSFPKERQDLLSLNSFFSMSKEEEQQEMSRLHQIAFEMDSPFEVLRKLYRYMTESKKETKLTDNAIGQINSLIGWAGNRSFREQLVESTFSFDELQNGNMTVYVIVPEDAIDYCAIWIRILFESAISSLKDVNTRFGKASSQLEQRERVLFMLDEVPAFGKLDAVSKRMATIRGRGANLWLILQHVSQLDKVYGEHDARQILGNAALLQAFESNEVHELEYLSKVIGTQLYDVKTVNISRTRSNGGSVSETKTKSLANTESESKGQSESETLNQSRNWSRSVQETEGTSHQKTSGTNESMQVGTGTSTSRGGNVSRGENTGWNESYGTNKGRSRSTGFNKDYDLLDYAGVDMPLNWEGKNVSESVQNGSSRNWGRSGGRNFSRGRNWQSSKTRNETVSKGRSLSEAHGTSYSRGTTEGEGRSEGQSQTEGWSRNSSKGTTRTESDADARATNWSQGENYGVSVKPEERPIETSRSLRKRLSRGNQLLVLRGHYPFVCPRMDYIATMNGSEAYRFPSLAIMSGIDSPYSAWARAASHLGLDVELDHVPVGLKVSDWIGGIDDASEEDLVELTGTIYRQAHEALRIASTLRSVDDDIPSVVDQCRAGFAFTFNASELCGGLPEGSNELEEGLVTLSKAGASFEKVTGSTLANQSAMHLDVLESYHERSENAPPTVHDIRWILRMVAPELETLEQYSRTGQELIVTIKGESDKYIAGVNDSLQRMVDVLENSLLVHARRNNDRREEFQYGSR